MPRRTLNDRILKSCKPSASGRYEIMDTVVPGLGVRVSERGIKSFILVARYPGSANPTRRSLGEYGALTLEAARTRARHWHELLRRGIDPALEEEHQRLAVQRKQANSFAAVCADFIANKLPDERRGKDAEQDLRRVFIPAWGGRPITDITPLDVRAIIVATKARGHRYQAFNLLALVRRLFEWAIDQHVYGLAASPVDRLKPRSLIGARQPRQRVLSVAEWRALWQATQTMGYVYGPLVRILALCGVRKDEAGSA